jgi:hypothetical protein
VAERAAQRAAVADLPVADKRDGPGEQGDPLPDDRRRLQRRVPGERAHPDHAVAHPDAIESGNPVDVDHRGWAEQPHAQEWHQALPAREQPGVAVEAREGGESLLGGRRCEVLEGSGLHPRYAFRIAERSPTRRRGTPIMMTMISSPNTPS